MPTKITCAGCGQPRYKYRNKRSRFTEYKFPDGEGLCEYCAGLENGREKRAAGKGPDDQQIRLFEEIFAECGGVSRVSGTPLEFVPGDELFHYQFNHLVSKDLEYFKFLKKNIWPNTCQEHDDYHNGHWLETYPQAIVEKIKKEKQEMMLEYNEILKNDLKILKNQ